MFNLPPKLSHFFHRHDRAMRQWDGPKRLRDRLGSILGSLRALRGTPDADRDASNWSPNLVWGGSQGPDRSSSLSSVTRPLIFGAGRRARAGSERCFGNKTFDFSNAKSKPNFDNIAPRLGQNIAFGTKLSAQRRGFFACKIEIKLRERRCDDAGLSRQDLVRTLLWEQNFRYRVEDSAYLKPRTNFKNKTRWRNSGAGFGSSSARWISVTP